MRRNGTKDANVSFVPVIDQQGIIKVYAADCVTAASQGALWQFIPDKNSSIGNGTWNQLPLTPADRDTAGINYQPSIYLAGGIAHTSSGSLSSSVYTFGGMCPLGFDSPGKAGDTSLDHYSQSMILLEPSNNDTRGNNLTYKFRTTGGRALPVPEAGFTLTPLESASTTTSTGGTLEQQTFVLIGGHSSNNSFIDMTHLGLFSLPEKSWSFIDINAESGSDEEDEVTSGIMVGNSAKNAVIQPRSGHTAVLSADGSKVIVFGGWVGNTSTAAEPQLAILEVGEGYGGTGRWAWKTPSLISPGLSGAAGIYGHGATMLPGDMMMIAGGYTIPQSNNISKRAPSQAESSSQVYLYNITANTWATSYTNPNLLSGQPSQTTARPKPTTKPAGSSAETATITATKIATATATADAIATETATATATATKQGNQTPSSTSTPAAKSQHGALSSTGKRAGLGVGVGLGGALIGLLALLGCLGFRRRQRETKIRDDTIRELSRGAERSHYWPEPNMSSSFRNPGNAGGFWDPRGDAVYPWIVEHDHDHDHDHDQQEESSAEQTSLLGMAATTDMAEGQHSTAASTQRKQGGLGARKPSQPGEIHPIDEREEDEENVTQHLIPQSHQGEATEASTPLYAWPLTGTRDFAPLGRNNTRNLQENEHTPPPTARTMSDLSTSSYSGPGGKSPTGNHKVRNETSSVFSSAPPGMMRLSAEQTPPSTSSSGEGGANSLPMAEKHASADSFSTAFTRLSLHQGERESLLGGGSNGWHTPPETLSRTKSGGTRPKAYDIFGNVRRALSGTFKGSTTTTPISSTSKRYPSAAAAMTSGIDRSPTVVEPPSSAGREPRPLPPRRAISASAASAAAYGCRKGAKDWGYMQPGHNRNGHGSSSSYSSAFENNRGEGGRGMQEIHPSHTRIPKIIPLATQLDGLYAGDVNDQDHQDQSQRQSQQLKEDNNSNKYNDDDEDYDGEEWDVEAAAERRQVQMTFTIPRERLRVVNVTPRDMDNYSERSSIRKTSDRHVSG